MDFSIGDLSRRTGVKVPTIRYYEKEGLLEAPLRSEGNQRRYRSRDLERLGFIKHCRDLGLPMPAIRDLIDLSQHPDKPCETANRIAEDQLKAVRQRIAHLRKLEAELKRIATSCEGDHTVTECNVLKAFGDHGLCLQEH
ncbi:putative transcription regulator protein [Stappia aggregata IAM 12614]|uniref:Putative transcription regulator protein n=1 Tax=Roseibium aggregatum (strain ATCC 25650 / DSM 13394 / JCM 20685 / NBRC 16684 / NCIMB 2208 / IAM 12614 / B1) TaxID=384765 RepID=A0NUR5_ROSAI|nr:helix-turn-helix domain-containing protein [Roseibium aggregatum]EAV43667.1 putative transcription regulator protein [Stappia aggregata IAM 12614] [Roseibium aggregatum IAM 12614]